MSSCEHKDLDEGEGVQLAIEAVGATPTVQQAMAMAGLRGDSTVGEGLSAVCRGGYAAGSHPGIHHSWHLHLQP